MRDVFGPGRLGLARFAFARFMGPVRGFGPLLCFGLAIAVALVLPAAAHERDSERRLALVIGNQNFEHVRPLRTAANDAGLIAQTLQAAGFEVLGARDLDAEAMRDTFNEFLDHLTDAGPDAVAFVYLAGYGVQADGENYMLPVDARIGRGSEVAEHAVKLDDLLRPLASLPLRRRLVVLDLAHGTPFHHFERPLAPGLAYIDSDPGMMVAFNAAPDTVAPDGDGPYGAYAQALAEMMRTGDLDPAALLARVRLRVSDVTDGAVLPWNSSNPPDGDDFVFFERTGDAPPQAEHDAWRHRHARDIRDFNPDEAYLEVIDRDSLQGYLDFLQAFPDNPLARRVRAIVAARREAMIWRRMVVADSREAYWTYLERYPDGPHVWDARRRLRQLDVEHEPPQSFERFAFDIPLPDGDEVAFIGRQRGLIFADRSFEDIRAPQTPQFLLPPRSSDIWGLDAPQDLGEAYVLPVPVFLPLPRYIEPPRYVHAPPDTAVFENLHGGPPPGEDHDRGGDGRERRHGIGAGAGVVAAVAVGAAAFRIALPPSLQHRQDQGGGRIRMHAPDGPPPLNGAPAPGQPAAEQHKGNHGGNHGVHATGQLDGRAPDTPPQQGTQPQHGQRHRTQPAAASPAASPGPRASAPRGSSPASVAQPSAAQPSAAQPPIHFGSQTAPQQLNHWNGQAVAPAPAPPPASLPPVRPRPAAAAVARPPAAAARPAPAAGAAVVRSTPHTGGGAGQRQKTCGAPGKPNCPPPTAK